MGCNKGEQGRAASAVRGSAGRGGQWRRMTCMHAACEAVNKLPSNASAYVLKPCQHYVHTGGWGCRVQAFGVLGLGFEKDRLD